jgi:hypothetical protein
MPMAPLEVAGWFFFSLIVAAVVLTCAWFLWLNVAPTQPAVQYRTGAARALRGGRVQDEVLFPDLVSCRAPEPASRQP